MRRAILALGSTIAGIVVLLSFKTHSIASLAAPVAAPSTAGGTASSAPAAGAADAAGAAHTGATARASTKPRRHRKRAAAQTQTQARMVAGAVAETARGPMQVELTLTGQRITAVTMLQRTNDGPLSDQIDAGAIPKLISETLTAQSAKIDAVSGATYTSEGYIQSLQSALDKAGA
jgi:uncharacterized protein with FMN-binding domain